ncbi:MAG: hypothetical protein WD077_16260 [Bacteroidia bacterium]
MKETSLANTKLIMLLKTLNDREWLHLAKFIESPYFNVHEGIHLLFEALQRNASNIESVTKSSLYKAVFGEEKYNDLRLRHLLSDFLKLLEHFLVVSALLNDEQEIRVRLLNEYRQRDLEKHFTSTQKLTDKAGQKSPVRDGQFYLHRFRVEQEKDSFLAQQLQRSGKTNIEPAAAALDIFYVSQKLRWHCLLLNNRSIVGDIQPLNFMEEILGALPGNPVASEPVVAVYVEVGQMLQFPDQEEHYHQLKVLLQQEAFRFSQEEARELYAFARNYCIRKINSGIKEYLREIFGLYRQALEQHLLLEEGFISPWDYKNIVVTGLRLGEFSWVQNFLNEYRDRLEEKFRENAFTYNLAKFHFYRQNHPEVVRLLSQVEYDDVFYSLDSRSMLLKTYYELNEVNALFSLLDSFSVYLRRNKLVSAHHKTNYANLIRYTRKMLNLKPGAKEDAEKLRKQIQDTRKVADADWLLEKLAELG